jgi:predicted porin
VGFALDERTDLQVQYSYYQSDDYINNSAVSTPYGDESREHGVTVALSRMLTPRLRLTLKYGFFDYDDDASGGHNDYTAHMAYSGLQYRF